MKGLRICYVVFVLLAACSEKPSGNPDEVLTKDQQQAVLLQAVKFMYFNEAIPSLDRFLPKFHDKFVRVLPQFTLSRLSLDGERQGYFLMIRSYPAGKYRATCGKLALSDDNTITAFEEIVVSPLLTLPEANERGEFLYHTLLTNGSIEDKYLKMRSYVEWPDDRTVYDKNLHQWTAPEQE